MASKNQLTQILEKKMPNKFSKGTQDLPFEIKL